MAGSLNVLETCVLPETPGHEPFAAERSEKNPYRQDIQVSGDTASGSSANTARSRPRKW